MEDLGLAALHLLIDHDGKYAKAFDAVFAADDVEIIRVGPRAPNVNTYDERFGQTLRTEYLDHFVVFGEKHLRHLVSEFLTSDNTERPHQGDRERSRVE